MEHTELKLWEGANSTEHQNSLETSGKSGARDIISKTERKLIVKRLRATIPIGTSGVYQIKNKANGRYYIGSARDIFNRFLTHLGTLINNSSHNKRLQDDWNTYSYRNFEFSVLEVCERNLIMDVEQRYLDAGFLNTELIYNKKPVAKSGVTGRYSLDLRRKMSAVQKRNETKYDFYNIATKESLFCSIFELRDKYPDLNRKILNQVVKGRCDSYRCWTLKQNLEKVLNNSTIQGKTTNARIKTYEERKNPKIYNFYNLKTKEEFVGSKFDFIDKYYETSFSTLVNNLVNKKCLSAKLWILKERLDEVLSGGTFASNYLLSILNRRVDNINYELINVSSQEVFKGTKLEFLRHYPVQNNQLVKRFLEGKMFNMACWVKMENYKTFLRGSCYAAKKLKTKLNKQLKISLNA